MAYWIIFGMMVLCFFASNIKSKSRDLSKSQKILSYEGISVIILSVGLFLLLALQSETANNDLFAYKMRYEENGLRTFSYFINDWAKIKDPVYHICGWIFSRLGFDFFQWKVVISFVFVFGLYNVISKYSVKPSISFMVITAMGPFSFAFSGLRQALALSILFYSYKYMKEKRLVKFLLIVLFASLFHSSALVFAISYFAYNLGKRVRNLILLGIGGLIIILNANTIARIYMQILGVNEQYSEYFDSESTLNFSGIIIYSTIFIFCLICTYGSKRQANDAKLCHLLLLSVVFRILSFAWLAEIFRIAMYFSLFDGLLIADACMADEKTNRRFAKLKTLGVTSALILYYLISPSSNILSYILQ
ncbi:MAG: EpsG family protein [Clostridia bacterium]|nr:EpsG family protein [Clostridia bacterium]